ncbi:MAG: superoxide dismutase [Fidelibacterota bacterium]|nr:MAG: superoxide dismutase [Candidatus Neomarinimicrobiota bacterium]
MAHEARDFGYLLGTLEGISDELLEAHFGLYKGYVARLNLMEEELKKTDKGHANYSWGHWSELKRREAVAFNGTYLHELYFENLQAKGDPSAELKQAIDESFGSYDEFLKDLKATGLSTIGWVVLTKSRADGKLHTYLLTEHHTGLPVLQDIILVLDSFEHAFAMDYGTNRGGYIDTFVQNINWEVVNQRFAEV